MKLLAASFLVFALLFQASADGSCCNEINKRYVNHANSLANWIDPLYTQAVEAGRLIFLASQTGNPGDNPYPDAWDCSIYNQTKVALQNLEYALAALGLNREYLVKIVIWTYPTVDASLINAAFDDFFQDVNPKPVRIIFNVSAVILFSPYKIQLDAYAYNPHSDDMNCKIPVEAFSSPDLPADAGYPHAIRTGPFVHIGLLSGKKAEVEAKEEEEEDVELQTKQALQNLETALKLAGATKNDLIEVKILTRDIAHKQKVDEVYREFVKDIKPLPARSLFGGLFSRDGALVMVEATAYLKSEECAEPVKAIRVPELFGEPSLYSQGVQVGNFIFTSGTLGNLANTTYAFRTDPAAKNRSMEWEFYQSLLNIERILARAGADRTDLIWTYNYLADLMLFPGVNRATIRYFQDSLSPVPARVDGGSVALPFNALVQTFGVAYKQTKFAPIPSRLPKDWNTSGAVPGTPATECFY